MTSKHQFEPPPGVKLESDNNDETATPVKTESDPAPTTPLEKPRKRAKESLTPPKFQKKVKDFGKKANTGELVKAEYGATNKLHAGHIGNSVKLVGNYYYLKLEQSDKFENVRFIQYDVKCDPFVGGRARNDVVTAAFKGAGFKNVVYDGKLLAYVRDCDIPKNMNGAVELKTEYNSLEYLIKMTPVSDPIGPEATDRYFHVVSNCLKDALRKEKLPNNGGRALTEYLNCFYSNVEADARKVEFYDQKSKTNHAFRIVPGYKVTLQVTRAGFMLNIDERFRIFKPTPILNLCGQWRTQNPQDFQEVITRELKGKVAYNNLTKKFFRIENVDFSKTSGFSFKKGDQEITIGQYFQQTYGVKILEKQPWLVGEVPKHRRGGQAPMYPCELCFLTGLTDRERENFMIMSQVALTTKKYADDFPRPARRGERQNLKELFVGKMTALDKFYEKFFAKEDTPSREMLKSIGLVPNQTVNAPLSSGDKKSYGYKLMGRLLPRLKVNFGGSSASDKSMKDNDWQSDIKSCRPNGMTDNKDIKARKCIRMAFVYGRRSTDTANRFVHDLCDIVAKNMKLDSMITRRGILNVVTHDTRPQALEKALNDNRSKLIAADIIVVMLFQRDQASYEVVKNFCLLPQDHKKLLSQVFVERTYDKAKLGFVTKLLTQMISKMNFIPWKLSFPKPVYELMKSACVVGIDLHRDSATQSSFMAATATMDTEMTRHSSRAVLVGRGEEVTAQKMAPLVTELLRDRVQYAKKTSGSVETKNLIIFRDGVSEKQMEAVYDNEVIPIMEEMKNLSRNDPVDFPQPPKVTFILVIRRNSAKFFSAETSHRSQNEHPQCRVTNMQVGTVVDGSITSPIKYQFYLATAKPKEGMMLPVRYEVWLDENNTPVDIIQQLTYMSSAMYYNQPATIKVPAVCQQAIKMAKLLGVNVHDALEGDNNLRTNPFYL